MKTELTKGLSFFFFFAVCGILIFQNCSPVDVSQIQNDSSVGDTGPVAELAVRKDCDDIGKKDGDLWWVPNGTTRDIVACTTGNGSQFKVFDEEVELKCDNGLTVSTGQSRRNFTGRLEGLCNLDCGDKKNGEKWWAFQRNTRDTVQCMIGTGAQLKVFDEESELQCINTMIVPTGATRRVDTGRLEGTCNLDCGTRKNAEKWWVPAGTTKEPMQCTVGTGTQYKIFNQEIEYVCMNAVSSLTGLTRQIPTGQIEGTCNLDCGTHKNNELWWMDLGQSTETRRCSTALNVNSTVTYKNEAEYKCTNAVTSATGNTKKTIISETECPPLTFNNQDSIATVAYEDIYPGPGDADYNDFVANIKVQETYNSLDQLTKITIEYMPRVKLAGYFAKFVLVFDGQVRGRDGFVSNVRDFKSAPMFEGNANIKMEMFNSSGTRISVTENIPKDQDLVVFSDTTKAVAEKPRAMITITGLDGTLNTLSGRKGLSIKRYRSVLFVTTSANEGSRKYDIELSDINPTMFDSKQLPLAFFVPVNWKPPGGEVNILGPYPRFKDHANYLYSNQPIDLEPQASREWYNYLADPTKVMNP